MKSKNKPEELNKIFIGKCECDGQENNQISKGKEETCFGRILCSLSYISTKRCG